MNHEKQLEETVECVEDESPSTYLKTLLAAGNNQFYRPIDALPANAAIKRKLTLLLSRTVSIDETWLKNHLNTFLDSICTKKLGGSLHKFVKSELIKNCLKNLLEKKTIFSIF